MPFLHLMMTAWRHIAKHFLVADVLVVAVAYYFLTDFVMRSAMVKLDWKTESARALFAVLACGSTSVLGFTITGITVIGGLVSNERLMRLGENHHLGELFDVFFSATRWLATTAVMATAGMVVSLDGYRMWGMLVAGFVVTMSVARTARVVWVLSLLAHAMVPPTPMPPTLTKGGVTV